jgi:hypothetical protein
MPDAATIGVSLLITLTCAVALRNAAERLRERVRSELSAHIINVGGLSHGARVANQLSLLLHPVDELKEGAFSPFSQQPLVRAMLLPIGSVGGTVLLEYFLPAGLT